VAGEGVLDVRGAAAPRYASAAMAQLWLLRHGEAVPHESKPDADRELTGRGERQAIAAGAGLARLGVEFGACYTSPKLRALDTARLACEALNIEPQETDVLGDGFTREAALELLLGYDDDARVLVVGHEPSFSQVVHDLTGARIDFKKGGVAAVSIYGSRGELLVLLRPRELETLAVCHEGRRPV
jgi:phosphohistidine phosphatase